MERKWYFSFWNTKKHGYFSTKGIFFASQQFLGGFKLVYYGGTHVCAYIHLSNEAYNLPHLFGKKN